MTKYIVEKLNLFWSPELITKTYKISHPEEKISYSTIYAAIKNKELQGITAKKNLRRQGKPRKRRNCATIKPTLTIQDRPIELEERKNLGDFEGDTVLGGVGKGCIATYFDRKSRLLIAGLMENKSSKELNDTTIAAFDGIKVNSITLDNGSEFARLKELIFF